MISEVLYSSNSENWETPKDFFWQLNKEFNFTLDPCADEQNHKCEKYYTKKEDGLAQDWGGETVFCNPPYGKEISKWVKKAYEEGHKPNTVVVLLVHARTDTKWFQQYCLFRSEIRFISGRLKFGGSKNSAPFPSMLVIFRGGGIIPGKENVWQKIT